MKAAASLVGALTAARVKRIFTLSGNQILPVYDACVDAGIELLHVRHEAAAVHMADAWARLTGQPGVALVAAASAHANALGALYVAQAAESPVLLLSGHCPRRDQGRGGFQDVAQARMAAPVCKAAWTSEDPRQFAADVGRAVQTAMDGRPGPVHLSLPMDLLDAAVAEGGQQAMDGAPACQPGERPLGEPDATLCLRMLAEARRPLVLCGPAMLCPTRRDGLKRLQECLRVPVVAMESPRGIDDPALGHLAGILSRADLVVLLAKRLDFTLRMGYTPPWNPATRVVIVDPDPLVVESSRRCLGAGRAAVSFVADAPAAIEALCRAAESTGWTRDDGVWLDDVAAALARRVACPPDGDNDAPPHPAAVCRQVSAWLAGRAPAVFVCDGGEFAQWAQAALATDRRVINGPSGTIGGAVPFALAARLACPEHTVLAVTGDGAFGFHAMEIDTAVRYELPLVVLVGNDAGWNAERVLQRRHFGADRMVACDLLPTRYDRVVEALGGYGEYVERLADLLPALDRAADCGQPACVNVRIQPAAAPIVRD